MAIEPLGSIMSAQMQQVQRVQPQKAETVNTEVNPAETQVNNIDTTTVSVADVSESPDSNTEDFEENGSGDGNQYQQRNEKIKKAVEQLNKGMNNSEAVFGIHEATNRVTIKIIDKTSKKVIKELPPEKTLDMIAKVWEMAGLLVDEKR